MSEMTQARTREGLELSTARGRERRFGAREVAGAATIAALAVAWFLVARWVWRTTVPSDLHPPHLRASDVFRRAELRRTAAYARVADLLWVLGTLAGLATVAAVALRGRSLAARVGIGRVGTGVVLGALVATASAAASLPFALAFTWWNRRHGLSRESYVSVVGGAWGGAIATALAVAFVVAVALGFAARFGRLWWCGAAPVFVALVALVSFGAPYLVAGHPPGSERLRREARALERATGTTGTPVRVEDVRDRTNEANAYSVGFGPSRRVVLWNTILRFPRREVRAVLAHELGHVARGHLWKAVIWFGLFLVPLLALLAEALRRVGGLTAATVPLALLAALVLSLLVRPAENVVSRRYEAEADWVALRTTHDPGAARSLFRRFSTVDLAQPTPPTWDYVLLEDHPTTLQRIAMAAAWKRLVRNRGRASRGGS
jgi:STE24 endopeptidase